MQAGDQWTRDHADEFVSNAAGETGLRLLANPTGPLWAPISGGAGKGCDGHSPATNGENGQGFCPFLDFGQAAQRARGVNSGIHHIPHGNLMSERTSSSPRHGQPAWRKLGVMIKVETDFGAVMKKNFIANAQTPFLAIPCAVVYRCCQGVARCRVSACWRRLLVVMLVGTCEVRPRHQHGPPVSNTIYLDGWRSCFRASKIWVTANPKNVCDG